MTRSLLSLLLTFVTALLAGSILASCSPGDGPGQAGLDAPEMASFQLAVNKEATLLDGAKVSRFELEPIASEGDQELLVSAVGAENLKAAYFTVAYDPSRYSPVLAEPMEGIGNKEDCLHIAVVDDPGMVHFGLVLKNWDSKAGASGDLPIARIRFAAHPYASEALHQGKSSSTPPLSNDSAVNLNITGINLFNWHYANQGDYNQDGLVGIEDLTPLGLHFNEVGPFAPESALSVIDGNQDGEINVSDITPIGANFGASVLGGYNIYGSVSLDEYPLTSSSISLSPPMASIGFAESMGDRAVVRRLFAKEADPGVPAFYAWVRPVDELGNEGTPSDHVYVDVAGSPVLSLVSAPLGGSGTYIDPYIVDPLLDYEIAVTHPTLGDVTSELGILYTLTPLVPGETAGFVDTIGGMLQVEDEFTGMFTLAARFNDRLAFPGLFFRVVDPGNAPPVAFFLTDVNSGPAPLYVGIDGSGSHDPDGVIISYEWDFETDGTWDEQLSLYEGPLTNTTYSSGGLMTITLRVTDDNGATDSTSWPVDVEGWQRILIDDRAGAGIEPSLALIDGLPAIAYGDSGGNVNYVRAADSSGNTWSGPLSLSNTFTASQITMIELDGGPAIAYRRASGPTSGIQYTRSPIPSGAGWNSAPVSTGAGDHSPSLRIVGGRPAVAYVWDSGAPDNRYVLSYVRSTDATGTGPGAWDSFPSLLFSAEQLELDRQSLILTQNKPSVIFLSNDDELGDFWHIRYIIADDIPASGWGFPAPVFAGDSGTPVDYFAVTTIVERANLAWRRDDLGLGNFRRAGNLDGSGWGSIYGISDVLGSGTRGFFMDLANVAGFPALVHFDTVTQQLRYARTTNPESTPWEGSVVATVGSWDAGPVGASYVSLGANAGKPMIAYYDATEEHLYFSTYYEIP